MLLPDDVLDYILSFLQSDFRALEACSRCHSRFIPLVERYIYASITLYDTNFTTIGGHDIPTPEFISHLSDKPHIVNYIRNLEVSVAWDITSRLENITSILPMCSLLTKITFGFRSSKYWRSEWTSLPEDFRLAFFDCLRIPSMKAVCIMFASGFPLKSLSSSKSVKSLTLCGSFPDADSIADNSYYPLLDDLAIQHLACRERDLRDVIRWVRPNNLRSLEVSRLYKCHDFRQLSKFLSSCSNTLTSLNLYIGIEFQTHYRFEGDYMIGHYLPDKAISIPLASLACLERLTISADLDFVRDLLGGQISFRTPIPTIAELLETALPLRQLTLNFHFCLESHLEIPYNSEMLWSPLVTLISKSCSPCTNLCIRTSYRTLGDTSPNHILSSFARCPALMQMVEQGILAITPVMPEP